MTHLPSYIGLDLAKPKFDFFSSPSFRGAYPNDPSGFRRFFAQLPPDAHLVCESTGPYHRPLLLAAHQAGIPISVVNGAQARHFITGLGQRAKTDQLDAKGLQRFAQLTHPQPTPAHSQAQRNLEALVVARQQTVLDQSTLQVQADLPLLHPLVRRQFATRLRLLKKQIEQLAAQIQKTIAQDEILAAKYHRLLPVQGVGPLTVASVLAFCPELGHLSRNRIAALTGLAPFPDESGDTKRPRHIQGGRFRLRCALFMAALSASRCNPILHPFYQHHRAKGKPHKLALVAVARKLIQLLNLLLKNPNFSLAS